MSAATELLRKAKKKKKKLQKKISQEIAKVSDGNTVVDVALRVVAGMTVGAPLGLSTGSSLILLKPKHAAAVVATVGAVAVAAPALASIGGSSATSATLVKGGAVAASAALKREVAGKAPLGTNLGAAMLPLIGDPSTGGLIGAPSFYDLRGQATPPIDGLDRTPIDITPWVIGLGLIAAVLILR